jgi:hypothetical protein
MTWCDFTVFVQKIQERSVPPDRYPFVGEPPDREVFSQFNELY